MSIERGQVVLVNFPFTDLSRGKMRPALVVSGKELNQTRDVMIVPITSQEGRRSSFNIKLSQDDLEEGTLRRPSTIRCHHLVTIEKKLISKTVALVKREKSKEVMKKIMALMS